MKIESVTVAYGKLINTGNYENVRVEIELAATLEPGDDAGKAADELRAQAKLQINRWQKIELNGNKYKDLDDDIPY